MCEYQVTPLVGVWIEIMPLNDFIEQAHVTPLVGVWIEMIVDSGYYILAVKSLPLWECGLK